MAGWRKWNVALHRDVGFAVAGLTLIYAISGVAVNHTHQWNPNYRLEREERRFEPIPVGEREAMVAELVKKLGLADPPRESFRSAPEKLELFYEGWSIKADASTGLAVVESRRERPVLRAFNSLHLNVAKGWWTWVADVYALGLAFLAVSGLLIPRGPKAITGHGKYWVLLGLAVPLGFLVAAQR